MVWESLCGVGKPRPKVISFSSKYFITPTYTFQTRQSDPHPSSTMPFFRRQSPRTLTSRVHLRTANMNLDPTIPFIVHLRPALPITTGTNVYIDVPRHNIQNVEARIGALVHIHVGYAMFRVRRCHLTYIRFIALPLDWVRLGPIDSFRHRRQIQEAQDVVFTLIDTPALRSSLTTMSEITQASTSTETLLSHDNMLMTTARVIRRSTSAGMILERGESVLIGML